jgi:hypothetical protein
MARSARAEVAGGLKVRNNRELSISQPALTSSIIGLRIANRRPDPGVSVSLQQRRHGSCGD